MYATRADMVRRFGEEQMILLTDHDADLGVIDSAVLDQALADASADIDGYLGGRYGLPLPTVPSILVRICCDIARYHLYDDSAPETVTERHKGAVRYLEKLAAGTISLGLPDTTAVTSSATAEIHSAGSVFARDKAKAFI